MSNQTKQPRYDRLILALTDDELESFTRDWTSNKKEYLEVERFTGPGDKGRDVVGYLTKLRHNGPWHNYQCKQYGRTVSVEVGLQEVGKILYYSVKKEFTAPTAYFFVAPRGVNRTLGQLISKPADFRNALIDGWDKYCSKKIKEGQTIQLDTALRSLIDQWDFSAIRTVSLDLLLADTAAKAALASWFGADPGPAPAGIVPSTVEDREMPYIEQLIDAYGERDEQSFTGYDDIKNHTEHGPHIRMQRERFFDADAFARFYRDNTMSKEIDSLHNEVFHGVFDIHRTAHQDSLARVDAVMAQAASVQPSGMLAKHARVPVKQGICHHFANEHRLIWRKR